METDPIQQLSQELDRRIGEHASIQDSDGFRAQQVLLTRLTSDFVLALRATRMVFTRYPGSGNWIQNRFSDDFLESAVSIGALARQGVFNAGRRELRYMLEAVVKCVFVDQQVPGNTDLQARLAVLNDTSLVPRSRVGPIDRIQLRMVSNPKAFTDAVHSAFGSLSGYTHMSVKQLDERLKRAERGEFTGFESSATVEAFSRLLARIYDLILVLLFEGVGPAFTGDLFVEVLDSEPDWEFHRGSFVREVSSTFDYKWERQREQKRDPN
jgi:hypothetical protein